MALLRNSTTGAFVCALSAGYVTLSSVCRRVDQPDGNGCILRFSDIVAVEGERSEQEITRSVLSGWHWYLDALEEALADRFVDRPKPEVEYDVALL